MFDSWNTLELGTFEQGLAAFYVMTEKMPKRKALERAIREIDELNRRLENAD